MWYVCAHISMHAQQWMCSRQGTTSGFGLYLLPRLRQGLFVVCHCAVHARLPGLQEFSGLLFPSHCSTDILRGLKSGFYISVARSSLWAISIDPLLGTCKRVVLIAYWNIISVGLFFIFCFTSQSKFPLPHIFLGFPLYFPPPIYSSSIFLQKRTGLP